MIIAQLRKGALLVSFIVSATIGLAALYADTTGTGLAGTMLYRTLGNATYLVFYGMILYLLVHLHRSITKGFTYYLTEKTSV